MSAEPPDVPPASSLWTPVLASRTRIACQDPAPEALRVPIEPITLPWMYGVLGYDGMPISAGDPCPDHPACGNAAGIVALCYELEDAEARAHEELVCAARARGQGDERVIQRLRVERLPGKNFTRLQMSSKLVAEASYVLSKGIGEEPWWMLVKVNGCQAALLSIPRGKSLFIFNRARRYLERRGPTKRITLV